MACHTLTLTHYIMTQLRSTGARRGSTLSHLAACPYLHLCPHFQLVFALVVTLVMAVVLLKLQPFVSNSDDTVSTMAQWVLFMQVFAGLLTKIQAQQACSAEDSGSFNANALA